MKQIMLRFVGSVAVVCSVAACASTPSHEAALIQEADDRMVADCEFLGMVSGSSVIGGFAQPKGRSNAKTAALEDAAKRGATHIVWTSIESTTSQGAHAGGRAYRCAK